MKEDNENGTCESHPRKIAKQSFLYQPLNKFFIISFFEELPCFKNWNEFMQDQNLDDKIIQLLRECDENT